MLLPVDVDQFLIVYFITTDDGSINNVCLNKKFCGFCHLPKEFFNMSQIKVIFANTINAGGNYYTYNADTKVTNHDSCRWENFVNLDIIEWLRYNRIFGNKEIIKKLKSF